MNRVKKLIYEKVPFVKEMYSIYTDLHYKKLYEKDPRLAAEEFYGKIHNGKKLNLENPETLEEKNIWLALNTDTTVWSKLSDKYAVREYIKECGLPNILNELYCKWDHVDDVDFSSLPKEFVIKANNSCATVLIVEDKEKLDIVAAKKKIKNWFRGIPYGYVGYNGHYLQIKPCIIAEKLLHDSNSNGLPIDYKFYCTYGKVFACAIMQDRSILNTHVKHTTFYDIDWNVIYDDSKEKKLKTVKKPASFDAMISYCYKLSKDFPLVRVDFYEIDDAPIFGEMTFTSSFDIFTDELNREFGKYVDLSKVRGTNNA